MDVWFGISLARQCTHKLESSSASAISLAEGCVFVIGCWNELLYHSTKNNALAKRHNLWYNICTGPGFKPDFATWLLENDVVPFVPCGLPDAAWLRVVAEQLTFESKQWDALQLKDQRHHVAESFRQDWKKGGHLPSTLVKGTNLGTLDSLMEEKTLEGRLCRARLTGYASFSMDNTEFVQVGSVWEFAKCQSVVSAVHENTVILQSKPRESMEARSVLQKSWTTDTEYIVSEVGKYWDKYWNADRGVDWMIATEMIQQMPQLQQFDARVSAFGLEIAIKSLSAGKSRGLDNWSNGELKMLSTDELECLAQLLNRILMESNWPDDLLDSAVTLLAKVQCPESPKHGRPITVLATIYRLWAKVQAQKMFTNMLHALPANLFGSIPHRSSIDAAWLIQDTLDSALAEHQTATAISLDLSKAYNTIQRDFLSELAAKAGWPPELIATYMNFLSRIRRRFKIHGGLHGSVTSKIGVPEGDPIAVVAMILVTWAVTLHIEDGNGNLASYVDNWTLMTDRQLQHALFLLQRMKTATDAMSLLLNPEKTKCFSTSAHHRKELRGFSFHGHPLHVCNQLQDLGVGYTATGQVTSRALHDRFQTCDHKLRRLQYMPWSATRKAEMVVKMISPAAFFGAAFATTSPSFLAMARGRFSSAIWGGANQRNHFLAPIFGTKIHYEPFLLVLDIRLQTLRRIYASHGGHLTHRWTSSLDRATGPLCYLFQHLRSISATLLPDFRVQFLNGETVSLVLDDYKKLQYLFKLAWCRFVGMKLQHKEEFRDIGFIDWDLTFRLCSSLLLNKSAIGNFTTGAVLFTKQKSHFLSETAAFCPHCGIEDTQHHRLFACPYYNECREGLPTDLMQDWPTLMTHRGFVKRPYAIQAWDQCLRGIPAFCAPAFFQEEVHLFTDGSTSYATAIPRSSWAVNLGLDNPKVLKNI